MKISHYRRRNDELYPSQNRDAFFVKKRLQIKFHIILLQFESEYILSLLRHLNFLSC